MKAGHQEIKVLLRYRFETSLSYKGSCLTKKERQGGKEGEKYLLNTNFGLPSSLCCTLTDPVASSEVVHCLLAWLQPGLLHFFLKGQTESFHLSSPWSLLLTTQLHPGNRDNTKASRNVTSECGWASRRLHVQSHCTAGSL